jgi:hypothetical protein
LNSQYPSKPLEASHDGGITIKVDLKDAKDVVVEMYESTSSRASLARVIEWKISGE